MPIKSQMIRDLLENGVHFGHQTNKWNPKTKHFIFGEKRGVYIIDWGSGYTRFDTYYEAEEWAEREMSGTIDIVFKTWCNQCQRLFRVRFNW